MKKLKSNSSQKNKDLPGYPIYPTDEDIYNHARKEPDLDPEDPEQKKTLTEKPWLKNEKDFKDDVSGSDLDIPGSELDDAQEQIGSEDEENNHYSLGDNK